MHELGITRSIVRTVAERAGGRPVRRVKLEIGRLAGVMPGAIRFCFDAVAAGTVLEGAALEIVEPEGRARCRSCGAEFLQETLYDPCTCGARDAARLSGEELNIVEFEFDAEAGAAIAPSAA